jgi:drug/metabolite transporter (DMT)-like permease
MTHCRANLLLLVAALLWGLGNVAQQTVLDHVGPLIANGLRMLIAIPVILPLLFHDRTPVRKIDLAGWKCAFITCLAFAAASTLLQIGYGQTTVTNAGFLVNTCTVLTPLIAWFFLLVRPPDIVWPAAAMTLTGAVFMGGGTLSSLSSGDFYCLMSAICYAMWMVFLGTFVKTYGRAAFITILQFSCTAIICLFASSLSEVTTLSAVVAALPELIMLGMVSTGAAYLLQAVAQRFTSASEAAVIVSAEALFGAIAAYLVLGESLDATRGLGAVLVFAGIVAVAFAPAFSLYSLRSKVREISATSLRGD